MMTRQAAHLEADRPLLRGICLVVKGNRSSRDSSSASSSNPNLGGGKPAAMPNTIAEFPRRPDSGVLSETIPLFFIGRNGRGLWIAREAEGRSGGIFLFRRSALRFAEKNSASTGCATMVLAARVELDVENRGNPLAAWLDAALRRAAGLIPAYPPPIPITRNGFKGERR
jgi:hypothetical protein